MNARLHPRHLGIVLVLVVTGAAYAGALGNPFFGSDTWPWLVSTRVESAGDVLRVAFSPIMSGTSFVAQVAHFYHPLTALSYSLDQILFGLHPGAFYATNQLIHRPRSVRCIASPVIWAQAGGPPASAHWFWGCIQSPPRPCRACPAARTSSWARCSSAR